MNQQENKHNDKSLLRNKVLGLGEKSIKKSYYSELQIRLDEAGRFRLLLDKVNEGIFIGRLEDGTIVDVNTMAESLFINNNNIEKNKIQNIIGDDLFNDIKESYKEIKDNKFETEKQCYYREVTIDEKKYEMSVNVNNFGEEAFFSIVLHDISERIKNETILKENRKYLQFILDSINDAIFIHDGETYAILDVNQRMCEMYGFTREEALTKCVEDISSTDDGFTLEKAKLILRKAKEKGDHTFEWLAKRSDKTLFWAEVSARFINIGYKTYFVIVVRDITERKKNEEEKLKLEQQLLHTQKLESLGILAGGIAHDFNNILTAILGHAELATLHTPEDSEVLLHLNEIKLATQRAAELSRQMLAYSGKGKFVVEKFNLNQLITQMLELLKVSISKKITLKLFLNEDIPLLEGGISQIRQVVMNLITNASEAIGDKVGFITITTGTVTIGDNYKNGLFINDNITAGDYAYFEVSDTGCGMDKKTIAKVFDPFFTTKFTGRGLGMSAVLGIIKSHKGTIHVSSEVGKGTCFRVMLPSKNYHDKTIKTGEYKMVSKQNFKGKVLIVDDESTILNIGKQYLKMMGFEIMPASDGQEALLIFEQEKDSLSLVILDLTMPNMSGEETFTKIKESKPDIKVLLMSGFSEDDLSSRLSEEGFAGFIQKPFTYDDFKEKIENILRR